MSQQETLIVIKYNLEHKVRAITEVLESLATVRMRVPPLLFLLKKKQKGNPLTCITKARLGNKLC